MQAAGSGSDTSAASAWITSTTWAMPLAATSSRASSATGPRSMAYTRAAPALAASIAITPVPAP